MVNRLLETVSNARISTHQFPDVCVIVRQAYEIAATPNTPTTATNSQTIAGGRLVALLDPPVLIAYDPPFCLRATGPALVGAMPGHAAKSRAA